MAGGVFLRRGTELIEMVEQPYELEDYLQELVERHPSLLAGDQVDPDAPRRWLVLSPKQPFRRRRAAPADGASIICYTILTELQRVVEFLNERMSPTEVLVVEIRQYTGGGEQTLGTVRFSTAGARSIA
jgi:hypothetical protein